MWGTVNILFQDVPHVVIILKFVIAELTITSGLFIYVNIHSTYLNHPTHYKSINK